MVAVFTVCERIMYGYMWRSISIFIRRTFCGGRVESNVLHDLIGTVTTISDVFIVFQHSRVVCLFRAVHANLI